MKVWSSWFLLLCSYFLIFHYFNQYSRNFQNRPLLLQGTTRKFSRIFCRFISPKIIFQYEKTSFKNLVNFIKCDLKTSSRGNSTKNSLIGRFCREKSQKVFCKISILKINFKLQKIPFANCKIHKQDIILKGTSHDVKNNEGEILRHVTF